MSSFRWYNGFRLHVKKHGCQLVEITLQNARHSIVCHVTKYSAILGVRFGSLVWGFQRPVPTAPDTNQLVI